MTGLTRYTPTSTTCFARLPIERSFDRLWNQFFTPAPLSDREEDVAQPTWAPAVDVKESDEGLTVYVELPGVEKKDIDVTLENNVLTVTGERSFSRDAKKENYHRIERAYGKFSRSFRLPASVKSDKVDANFKDGVLSLEIPKAEEARPRQIEIH